MTSFLDFTHLDVRLEGSLLRVTLNRPERFNALNDGLIEELRNLFTLLSGRQDIRVVLLGAAGKHFCVGLDLGERSGGLPNTQAELASQRRISEIVMAMRRCPQPIITLVNGTASGGGFAIVLASDVRLATSDMRMNAGAIRLGLGGCDIGSSYFLPRMVGSSVAAEYLLTGRFITAERAAALGLVSAIHERPELEAAGEQLAADMLHASPMGLRLTKEGLTHAMDASSLEAVIALEDRGQVLCAQSPDFAEGIAAFREKRAPSYAMEMPSGEKP